MSFDVTALTLGELYPTYLAKVERKGRSEPELRAVLAWLFDVPAEQLERLFGLSLREIFSSHPLHPNAGLIRGSVCGVKVHEVEDPIMRGIRMADKLVDELAKGKDVKKIQRSASSGSVPPKA